MPFEVDEIGHVVLGGKSSERVCFVLEDSLFDLARHADVENPSLACQDVDVVDLWHPLIMRLIKR
jgi:hypothetical protein